VSLSEIKAAVEAGKTVHWASPAYRVIRDSIGQWLIKCSFNGHCWGLTWCDGVTVNGKPDEFWIEEEKR